MSTRTYTLALTDQGDGYTTFSLVTTEGRKRREILSGGESGGLNPILRSVVAQVRLIEGLDDQRGLIQEETHHG